MKENILKKEWSKKDVKRARNLIQGKSDQKIGKGIGYNKKQEFYSEGDTWEEYGRTWTIKEGLKQNITKYDNIKKLIRTPLFCPQCKKQMKNYYDSDFYRIHKKCFNCVIDFEHELKRIGAWDEYLKNLHNNELDAFIINFREWVYNELTLTNNSFISEAGDVEKWEGNVNKNKALESLDNTIKYLENLKK
jgi:hypothetical protein